MPKICYVPKRFGNRTKAVINTALAIIEEYAAQGFDLTLRQLFYQFVARDYMKNTMKNYKRLGANISDARLAGLIDWNHITDRTRNLADIPSWDSPQSIIASSASCFQNDLWARQPYRPEVWIEKEALAGVFARVCTELRVPYFSCRGYTSQSEMWVAGQRLLRAIKNGQTPTIFHFGDHDPSGLDMTRDIQDRLNLFLGDSVELERLALNMPQVKKYKPPPNPAKTTDSRYKNYIKLYGNESWELDALEPSVLADLVRQSILDIRDEKVWKEDAEVEAEHKRKLGVLSVKWKDIVKSKHFRKNGGSKRGRKKN